MNENERQLLAANEASRVIRQRRAELKASVRDGAPLSEVLRDHGTALRAVPISQLVSWQRGVGDSRAARLLKGLPSRLPLGDLDVHQAALLRLRVITYERHRRRPVKPAVDTVRRGRPEPGSIDRWIYTPPERRQ